MAGGRSATGKVTEHPVTIPFLSRHVHELLTNAISHLVQVTSVMMNINNIVAHNSIQPLSMSCIQLFVQDGVTKSQTVHFDLHRVAGFSVRELIQAVL